MTSAQAELDRRAYAARAHTLNSMLARNMRLLLLATRSLLRVRSPACQPRCTRLAAVALADEAAASAARAAAAAAATELRELRARLARSAAAPTPAATSPAYPPLGGIEGPPVCDACPLALAAALAAAASDADATAGACPRAGLRLCCTSACAPAPTHAQQQLSARSLPFLLFAVRPLQRWWRSWRRVTWRFRARRCGWAPPRARRRTRRRGQRDACRKMFGAGNAPLVWRRAQPAALRHSFSVRTASETQR
jgi:hypothetical protein